jgi:apolipoprotein N-acyltransferase
MPFKRCFFLLVVSAILLVGSVLNPAAGWLVWIALVPFLVVLRSVGRTAGLLAGFGVGLIYFGTLFYWIALYEVRILVLTLVLSSLFFVVFSLLIIVAWEFAGRAWYAVFIPPAAWLAATFLFSLTPLPDLGSQLAISQAPVFPLITKLFGVSGMTFVVILANTLLAEWLYWERTQYAFGALILILFLFPGKQLAALPTGGPTLRVALVQHNFPVWTQRTSPCLLRTGREKARRRKRSRHFPTIWFAY